MANTLTIVLQVAQFMQGQVMYAFTSNKRTSAIAIDGVAVAKTAANSRECLQ